MARVDQKVNYYNFAGGKVSDANPLAPPENVVRTLLNVDLRRDGAIARRLGLEPEYNFSVLSGLTTEELIASGIDVYTWTGVDFNPELNFVVVRIGDKLYIYKPSVYSISTGLIHTIDISQFRTDSVALDVSNSFQAVSGKGLLVCSGGYYQPFYIKYDSEKDVWSSAVIQIRIRDFEGVDDGLEVNERPHDPHPTWATHPTPRHLYNLLNQGWARWEIDQFHSETGRYGGRALYPSNSDIASIGRGTGKNAGFGINVLTNAPVSTGRAPMGHFIIDPFDTTSRGTVAANEAGTNTQFNVGGEVINKRPKAVAFFAGRFFYGSVNGVIYYSKIVEGVEDLGKCYQLNDPTTPDFNQLLDTDGGTIKILGVGTVERMVPMGNSLVVLGTSGVYIISGGVDKGFTANNQQVGFLSNAVVLSYRSVVATNGSVLFWSDRGIFAIGSDEIGQAKIQSISDYKISKDYNNIPMAAKMVAQGFFEPIESKVWWLYSRHTVSLENTIINRYTDILILDLTTGAFTDYRVADGDHTDVQVPYPMMVCGLPTPTRVSITLTDLVEDNDGETVTSDSGDVYIERAQYGTSNTTLAVGTMLPDTNGDYRFTFSKFTSRTFYDWEQLTDKVFEIEPANYESIVETLPHTLGEPSVKKQTPYVYTYYEAQRTYPERDDPDGGGDTPLSEFIVFGHLNATGLPVAATAYQWDTELGLVSAYPYTTQITGGRSVAVAPDGNSIVAGGVGYPFIAANSFSPDTGWGDVLAIPSYTPPNSIYSPVWHVVFSPGGALVIHQEAAPPKAFTYNSASGTSPLEFSTSQAISSGSNDIGCFSPGGNFYVSSVGVAEYWNETTGFGGLASYVTDGIAVAREPVFHPSGNYVIVRGHIYNWNETTGFGTLVGPTGRGQPWCVSRNSGVLLFSEAYTGAPPPAQIRAVKWNEDGTLGDVYPPPPFNTGEPTPNVPASQSIYVARFGPDDKTVVLGLLSGTDTPLCVFPWSDDNGFGTALPVPPPTITMSTVLSIDFQFKDS